MTNESLIVKQVTARLAQLSAFCDTGYLLAVHIRYTRPSLMFKTYPQAWLDNYSERGLMMVDPVVRWGMSHEGIAHWDDLVADDPEGVVEAARAHGLSHGISFAIGPSSSRTIGSVTRSTAFTQAEVDEMLAIVTDIHTLTDGFDQFPVKAQTALHDLG